jgi:phage shock protein PspC (stress-responsive transcriptional regulator)
METSHQPLTRAARGRWVGGVCEGIARTRGIPAAGLRAAFVLSTAIAGLGALVYLACWMIIPAEGETAATGPRGTARPAPRAITSVILGCAAIAALGTLALIGAAATIFGFGWVVAVVAGAILIGALATWSRLGPAWALLPVAALVLPSIALAASGVHVAPETGDRTYAPPVFAAIPHDGYESGLGTMVIDLRHTTLPDATGLVLRVRGGLRRTIVALPHDRCIPTDVEYHEHPFAARAATFLTGDPDPYSAVTLFGSQVFGDDGHASASGPHVRGGVTTLHIDFSSAGGGLVVRDYPDRVDPTYDPSWPGFASGVEARPDTGGLTRRVREQELAAWRVRARRQRATAARTQQLIGGPCISLYAPRKKETNR